MWACCVISLCLNIILMTLSSLPHSMPPTSHQLPQTYREQLLHSCDTFWNSFFHAFTDWAISSHILHDDGWMVVAKSHPPLSICHRQTDNIIITFLPGLSQPTPSCIYCMCNQWCNIFLIILCVSSFSRTRPHTPAPTLTHTSTAKWLGDTSKIILSRALILHLHVTSRT